MFRRRNSHWTICSRKVNRSRQQLLERLEDRVCLSAASNWAVGLGSEYGDAAMALAVDGQDSAYVAVGLVDAQGGQQAIVAKYDSSGNRISAADFNLPLATTASGQVFVVCDLAVDDAGSLFVAGTFSGVIDLATDPNLEAIMTAVGGKDVFLVKYDTHGSLVWAERFGGAVDDEATGMDLMSGADGAGQIYVVGTFGQTASFATPSVPPLTSTVGDHTAAFVFHVTDHVTETESTPTAHWSQQLQTSGSFTPNDIVVSESTDGPHALIGGFFEGDRRNPSVFTTPSGNQTFQTGSYWAALLLKYRLATPDRGVQWAYQIARGPRSRVTGLATAADNSIYVVGSFRGSGDFGAAQLTASGSQDDGYVVRVDEVIGVPTARWVRQLDGTGPIGVFHLAVDIREARASQPSTIFVSGATSGILTPVGSAPILTERGLWDAFLLELPLDGSECLNRGQTGGTGTDPTFNIDVLISDSGSVYQLTKSGSLYAAVPTMLQSPGGSVVTEGEFDAVLVHVNPDAPQVSVTPKNSPTSASAIEQRNADQFLGTATTWQGVDLSGSIDWTLDGSTDVIVHDTTLDLPTALTLGRHSLTATVTDPTAPQITARYNYVVDVAPNSPTGLWAQVILGGKKSTIILNWTDNSSNENGFHVEQSTGGSDWSRIGIVESNVRSFPTTAAKNSGPIAYRIRSYATVGGLTVVSPVLEVVTVNPAQSATYYAATVAAVAASLLAPPTSADSSIGEETGQVPVEPTPPFRPGDANRDGVFNSSDLVAISVAGEYEDGLPGNSTWAEGDWNGDDDCDSNDLVLAFQAGLYEIKSQAVGNQLAAAVDSLFAQDQRASRPRAHVA